MLAAWALVPLVFLLLAGGAGLGVRRASGDVVPGALVPVCGFAVLVVYGWLAAQVAPGAIVLGSVAIALLGACAGLRRAPVPRPGALATGLGAFALFAAPIVLSGEATIAGYIKLDDTATWLAITDRVLDAGPSADGLSISTYEATLAVNFDNGYPYGALLPLGVAAEITGVDAAWAFQPYVAMLGAMLALALWQLAAPLAARPAARCACAVLASQSALLVGFYLWGGIKEVAMAMVAAGACALAAAFRPEEGAIRSLVPLGLLTVATVPLASPGALLWLIPAAVVLALRAFRSRWSWRPVALGTLGMTALLAAVLLSGRHLSLGRGSFTNQDDVGNLGTPLEATQVLGVWPSGDFRFAPDDRAVVIVAAAALATAAVAGIVTLVRRREWAPAVFPVGVAAVCLAVCALGSPWLDAKAMAIASPAILFAALVGLGLVRSTPIRIASLVLAGGLVVWSAVEQWGGASLAPRAQLSELEEIAEQVAGEGPTLMTEYSPYGARHFLRDGGSRGGLGAAAAPDSETERCGGPQGLGCGHRRARSGGAERVPDACPEALARPEPAPGGVCPGLARRVLRGVAAAGGCVGAGGSPGARVAVRPGRAALVQRRSRPRARRGRGGGRIRPESPGGAASGCGLPGRVAGGGGRRSYPRAPARSKRR